MIEDEPAAYVLNLGDYWREQSSAAVLMVIARLHKRRKAVADSPEGHRRGRNEAGELEWMRDTIHGHLSSDPDELLDDVIINVRGRDPVRADFLNLLIDDYARRYVFDTLRRR